MKITLIRCWLAIMSARVGGQIFQIKSKVMFVHKVY